MKLSKEKFDLIKTFDDDYSNLIISMYNYLTANVRIEHPEKVISGYEKIKKDMDEIILVYDAKWSEDVKIGGFFNISPKYALDELSDKIKNTPKLSLAINVEEFDNFPIWNTFMRHNCSNILEQLEAKQIEDITPMCIEETLKKYKISEVSYTKTLEQNFLVERMKKLYEIYPGFNLYYVGNNLSNEQSFCINEFDKFLYALRLGEDDRYSYIYDEVCKLIDEMVLKYNFCNFKDNLCLSQRHKNLFTNNYPPSKTDGCCYKVFHKCGYNNKDGTCKVKCISCKLFICPYIGKFGIGMYAYEFLLLNAFLTKRQRRETVYSFYKPKETILKRIKNG